MGLEAFASGIWEYMEYWNNGGNLGGPKLYKKPVQQINQSRLGTTRLNFGTAAS